MSDVKTEETNNEQVSSQPEIASSNNFLGLPPPPYSMAALKRSLHSNENFLTEENDNNQAITPRARIQQPYRFRSSSRSGAESNQITPQTYRTSASMVFTAPRFMTSLTGREKERVELSSLNDKFADYVEKVRYLEAQNRKIQLDTNFLGEKEKESGERIKAIFENEMKQIREIIETIFKEKSCVLGEVKELQNAIPTLKQQLNQSLKENDSSKYETEKVERQLASVEGEILMFQRRLNHQDNEQTQWKQYTGQLQRLLLKAKNEIHGEILNRGSYEQAVKQVTLEIERLREQQKGKLHELQQTTFSIGSSSANDRSQIFKSDLTNAIRKIRQDFERENERHRHDLYKRFTDTYDEIARDNPDISHLFLNEREQERIRQEEERLRFDIQRLKSEAQILRQRNSELKLRTREIQINLETSNEENNRIEKLQLSEIEQLKGRHEKTTKDYEDVINKQLSLEKEIETYRNLLEGTMKSFADNVTDDYSSSSTNSVRMRTNSGPSSVKARRSLSADKNLSGPFMSKKNDTNFYAALINLPTEKNKPVESSSVTVDVLNRDQNDPLKHESPIKESMSLLKPVQNSEQPKKVTPEKLEQNNNVQATPVRVPVILQTRRNN